jgi:hypothetical protein
MRKLSTPNRMNSFILCAKHIWTKRREPVIKFRLHQPTSMEVPSEKHFPKGKSVLLRLGER